MAGNTELFNRKLREAAKFHLFILRYGRKRRTGGLDPNDRDYDHRVEREIRRMRPERLDALLRDGEDEEPQGTINETAPGRSR